MKLCRRGWASYTGLVGVLKLLIEHNIGFYSAVVYYSRHGLPNLSLPEYTYACIQMIPCISNYIVENGLSYILFSNLIKKLNG